MFQIRSPIITLFIGVVFGISLTLLYTWFQSTEYVLQKIRQTGQYYNTGENISKTEKQAKILCWVMTGPDNHKKKAVHVKATWGKRFDNLVFMSSVEDKDLPAVALPVEEGRRYLWGKTREAFIYIYTHYNGTYDWVMKTDDDTYVIVENLRRLLSQYDPNEPLYLGCRFKGFIKQGYMAGGAGYVLSKEAVRRLIIDGVGNKKCRMQNDGGDEDAILGICLNKTGVKALDTTDKIGQHRFVQFSPSYVLTPTADPHFWYWSILYHHTEKGPNSCSETAISFHYIGPSDMYVFDYFLYHLRRPLEISTAINTNNSLQSNNASKSSSNR